MCCMMMHAMDHSEHDTQMTHSNVPQNESLQDILKRRYALGEITREQFEEMKRVLDLPDAPAVEYAHS
jgi:uncharacterized membrane protein